MSLNNDCILPGKWTMSHHTTATQAGNKFKLNVTSKQIRGMQSKPGVASCMVMGGRLHRGSNQTFGLSGIKCTCKYMYFGKHGIIL